MAPSGDVPAAGMLLLPGAGKGKLPSITQPVAHGPLVVLSDLIWWPTTELERIKPDPIPTTWLQLVGSRLFLQAPRFTSPPQHQAIAGQKNGGFVGSLGGLVIHVWTGMATQGLGDAWEPSIALTWKELGSGTHCCPFLCCLGGPQGLCEGNCSALAVSFHC